MDSRTCTGFSIKVGHEPKDSLLTVWTNWQKGAWLSEWPVRKRCITSRQIHVMWSNFVETDTLLYWPWLTLPWHLGPAPFIIHRPFVVDCRLLWEASLQTIIFLSFFPNTVKKGVNIQKTSTQYFTSQQYTLIHSIQFDYFSHLCFELLVAALVKFHLFLHSQHAFCLF